MHIVSAVQEEQKEKLKVLSCQLGVKKKECFKHLALTHFLFFQFYWPKNSFNYRVLVTSVLL